MGNDEIALYRHWLTCGLKQQKCDEIKFVHDSFAETVQQSLAYQEDAEVNGKPQPIIATRKATNKCDIALIPGDVLYIGDLVKVFNEYWICIEKYVDEFGMSYAELWMCNHIFCFQDADLNIIHKYAILDNGSYSKGNDKAIAVAENTFNCYMSLDDESRTLFIDKRLGISVIRDKNQEEVLEVGKIKWIDIKSRNFGSGSHLMVFGIHEDLYNPSTDSMKELICDYKEKEPNEGLKEPVDSELAEQAPHNKSTIKGKLSIAGRTTIKAGSCRTYTVSIINEETQKTIDFQEEVEWKIESRFEGISFVASGTSCKISIKEDDDLVGSIFTIKCTCKSGAYSETMLNVEVT